MARNPGAIASRLTDEERVAWRALQAIPNIGPAMAHDLLRLGIRRTEDLVGLKPQELYDRLAALDGMRSDPCVHDTFAAAIAYAETGEDAPWWQFTPLRKSPQ